MKALVPAKGFSNKASAAVLLLQTYVVSISAFSTSTAVVSREHRWGGVFCGAPTIPRYGYRSSTSRQSSAVAMSSTRQQRKPPLARTATLLQRTLLFQSQRTRVANTKHGRCSRGIVAVVPLEGATDGSAESPPASSSTTGIYVAAASPIIGSLGVAPAGLGLRTDAAELGAVAAPAAGLSSNGGGAAAPTLLSTKWGMKNKVRFLELPDDTAEEGRFLIMAALVGVITGTAGEKEGFLVLWVNTYPRQEEWLFESKQQADGVF